MKRLMILTVALLLGACASAGGPGSDRNLITREQIEAEPSASNAYQLVDRLRPQWLIERGGQALADHGDERRLVYLDNARMGGIEALRSINLASIEYLQFLDAAKANYRFGAGHTKGVILVSTQPQ